MRDVHELGLSDSGQPVSIPPPTVEQVAYVERLTGESLPPSYITLLRSSNGGHPHHDTFEYEDSGGKKQWTIGRFFSISSDPESTEDVVWNYHHRWSGLSRSLLPIAESWFGDILYLDLSTGTNAAVVIWYHEIPEDEQPLRHTGLSFEEMIDRLHWSPDNDL